MCLFSGRFGVDLREYCESGQMQVKTPGFRRELSNAMVQGSGGSISVCTKIAKGRKFRTLNLVLMTFSNIFENFENESTETRNDRNVGGA